MSTNSQSRIPWRKLLIDSLLDTPELPPIESLNLLLAIKNKGSIPDFSKQAGVSSQAIYQDVKGGKKCPKFRTAFQKVFNGVGVDNSKTNSDSENSVGVKVQAGNGSNP